MPGIDQILSIVVQQGANELRLGTDQEPQVLAQGTKRRFTMSPTSDSTLRQLLGDLLSAERDAELIKHSNLGFVYEARGIGQFQVHVARRPDGTLDIVFLQSSHQKASASTGSHAQSSPPAAVPSHMLTPAPAMASANEPTCGPQLLQIVGQAVQARASDIHLADGQPVFLRRDGRLRALGESRIDSVADLLGLESDRIERAVRGQGYEFSLALSPRERLRIAVYRIDGGLAAAIRLLPATVPVLSELGLPLPLEELAELPHGLVLVCGATGSGKSTTLAALARRALERRSILLVTLEDPIEFKLEPTLDSLVRQRQIGRDVPDFTTGLRDALRSDPDIIMVGELRDAETIRLALTAAETGHLVLASLHSGSAAACIERVIDAYPSEQRSQIRVQLAEALRAVVVQRLVPRARGTGRVPALEVLRGTHAVANVIREGKTAQIGSMLQAGKRDGMLSLERSLAEYVQAGTITLEQANSHANDVDSLKTYLSK